MSGSYELREQQRALYLDIKAKYAATIKRIKKSASWKEFCNMTSATNPWNEIYRIEAGKRKHTTQITTLRKPDGTLTKDLQETLTYMLQHFNQKTTKR
jgi:hypothetical protein